MTPTYTPEDEEAVAQALVACVLPPHDRMASQAANDDEDNPGDDPQF